MMPEPITPGGYRNRCVWRKKTRFWVVFLFFLVCDHDFGDSVRFSGGFLDDIRSILIGLVECHLPL